MSELSFGEMLSRGRIALDLKAEERWPAIVELVDVSIEEGAIDPDFREEILEALYQREEQISTAIGMGVAVPHAFSERLERPVVAYGFSRAGLDFESLDNLPVEFIVLILAPKSQSPQHLRTLATVAKLFHSEEVRDQLRACLTEDEVLQVLQA
jgi:mannitol/fructose-specific phosphotransferase system IIA component (Ntr-type)